MPAARTYNTFYKGIQQDDFITGGANFIEGNNVTGLKTGYGITLGPKSQKQIKTTELMRGVLERSQTDNSINYTYGDAGEIYRLTSTDLIPEHTLTNLYNIENAIKGVLNYFFAARDPGTTQVKISQITIANADLGNWVGNVNESFLSNPSNEVPAMLNYGDIIIIGFTGKITTITSGLVTSNFTFPTGDVVGLTLSGTTVKIYSDSGEVQFWDGSSTNFTSSVNLGFRVRRVVSEGTTDYITSQDGDMYIMSGYNSQRLIKASKSRRLNDNSQYIKKLNFVTGDTDNKTLEIAKGDIYMISGDNTKGIYQYGSLIEGLPKGANKILSQNSSGDVFTELTSLRYMDTQQKLMISGASTTENLLDFIDLSDLTTAKDGYVVSDVFTGGTTKKKKIDKLRITTSDTSGSNFIKLYVRKNNGTWELLRTINDTTDVIDRKSITEAKGDFIDIQFKVELHNDNQDDTPPIMHELYLEYSIIEDNG